MNWTTFVTQREEGGSDINPYGRRWREGSAGVPGPRPLGHPEEGRRIRLGPQDPSPGDQRRLAGVQRALWIPESNIPTKNPPISPSVCQAIRLTRTPRRSLSPLFSSEPC